ncbi:hypothetical protein GGR57DRAFT_516271 [Xylariaceae sp. FL1272]|nr:hypothetical protein GGR57DRAFT_516271 [Xylariaceae sp. FL1272]
MSKNHVICIHECVSSERFGDDVRQCTVRIDLDGLCLHERLVIHDPFEKEDARQYQWYLEEYILDEFTADEFNVSRLEELREKERRKDDRALTVQSKLKCYGKRLHRALELDEESLLGVRNLEISVFEAPMGSESQNEFCVRQVLWEILEQPSLWTKTSLRGPSSSNVNIIVRRIISAAPATGLPWEFRNVTRDAPLRVLLLIARNLTMTSSNIYRDIKANIAQIHLLSIQEDLAPLWYSPQIQLEIVRPGSFDALAKSLGEVPKGYFDLVHFDLHGQIGGSPKNSYLLFSSNELHKRNLEPRLATDVAQLLEEHGVKCVVTNACYTAAVLERREANMCQNFIDRGVSHISAMSHKICTSAVDLFYSGFYRALLVDGLKFAEATSKGRKRLRENANRLTIPSQRSKELRDWCVPVTYLCPEPQSHHKNYNASWLAPNKVQAMFRFFRECKSGILKGTTSVLRDSRSQRGTLALHRSHSGITASMGHFDTEISSPEIHDWYDACRGGDVTKSIRPMIDINVLDLERHLLFHRAVYFYGPKSNNNTKTVQLLSLFWCKTKFVERVIYVHAAQYLHDNPKKVIVEWDKSNPWKFEYKVTSGDYLTLKSPEGKLAIVIGDIHELYPEGERKWEEAMKIIERAREKLNKYLEHVRSRVKDKSRYIIITGYRDADWWGNLKDPGGVACQAFWRSDPLLFKLKSRS